MSDFRERARNHLRTAAGTYKWAGSDAAQLGFCWLCRGTATARRESDLTAVTSWTDDCKENEAEPRAGANSDCFGKVCGQSEDQFLTDKRFCVRPEMLRFRREQAFGFSSIFVACNGMPSTKSDSSAIQR